MKQHSGNRARGRIKTTVKRMKTYKEYSQSEIRPIRISKQIKKGKDRRKVKQGLNIKHDDTGTDSL